MKKRTKVLLIVSLFINAVLIGYVGYIKRAVIKNKISYLFKSETDIENSKLLAMNNVFNPLFVDTCNNKSGDTFKILVIGNSISRHGMAKDIGWNHINGMAATSIEKDYVHLLFKDIENKFPQNRICLRISSFATFERDLCKIETRKIDSLVLYQPDLIVFQLGENVCIQNKADGLKFEEKYIELINYFRKSGNPLIICTTPFFPSNIKNEIIEKVALSTNSYLVDLSHLTLLNTENYAKDDKNYLGDKSVWKSEGIGIHPGDLGMKNIEKQIFIIVNAALSKTSHERGLPTI